jgi:hypothetical protein
MELMAVPTQDQVGGQLRAIIPALGVIVSTLGIYNADKTGALVAGLLTAVGPISYIITAIWSAITHLQSNQIATVAAIATGPASPVAASAQKALIEATAAVASDKSIRASEDAKNTLIAATIALPEVQTIVTNAETAAASPSPSVVSAENLRRVGT